MMHRRARKSVYAMTGWESPPPWAIEAGPDDDTVYFRTDPGPLSGDEVNRFVSSWHAWAEEHGYDYDALDVGGGCLPDPRSPDFLDAWVCARLRGQP